MQFLTKFFISFLDINPLSFSIESDIVWYCCVTLQFSIMFDALEKDAGLERAHEATIRCNRYQSMGVLMGGAEPFNLPVSFFQNAIKSHGAIKLLSMC